LFLAREQEIGGNHPDQGDVKPSMMHLKSAYSKINGQHYSLGDLVAIVSSCAKDSSETIAALNDLFDSGRVAIIQNGEPKRVQVRTR
jgi:hypothetical protein